MKRKKGAACSQAASNVMHSLPRARARVVGHGSSPTEILKESLLDLPRTRARGGTKPQSDFAAWRVKTFGGDFDPVRVAVDEAVAELSVRAPARDRELWLKVANEIGYEAFRELYLVQKSIVDDCRRRGNPLRAPAAAFQARLNRYTGHGKAASCRSQSDSRPPLTVGAPVTPAKLKAGTAGDDGGAA